MMQNLFEDVHPKINDEIKTPADLVMPAIAKYIPDNLTIWECASMKDGSPIYDWLHARGFNVIQTTKDDVNFLTDVPSFNYDIIITNPPFSLKNNFLRRAFNLGKQFAFLLPITAIGSQSRYKMFTENQISVIMLGGRVDFTGKGNPWFEVAWFTNFNTIPKRSLIY